MRIAFFIEGMSASGVDTSTQLLAGALRNLGHEVVLFVPWKEEGVADHGETRVRLPAVRVSHSQPVYWSVPLSWQTWERFRRDHFDIIHVHTSTTVNLLAWQVGTVHRLPLVYTYHTMSTAYAHYLGPLAEPLSGVVHPAIQLFDRIICNQADAIVAPSRKAEAYLHEIGVNPPVRIIPNGINLGAFRPQPGNFLRTRLGITPDRQILLTVGRLNQEKRPLLAYSLFKQIHARHPAATLVMVGEGALRGELEERIAADGLGDCVHLAGLIDYAKMPEVYASADLWISASQSEVHPMTALEAAACGLPAVAWADPALEAVVTHGISGLIASSETAFIQGALKLLRDAALRERMAEATTRTAASFRVETTAQRMADLYASLLPQRPSHSFSTTVSNWMERTRVSALLPKNHDLRQSASQRLHHCPP